MEIIAGGSSELPVRLAVVIDGSRASKKLNTDTKDKELPSSGHVVLSNDDLLIEILLRSPAISIIQWKSVSKRWLSLITTPTFAFQRSQIPNLDPPSGLFLRRDTESSFEYDFVPLDIRIPASRSPPNINFTSGSAAGNVEILQSCNGLLLCCIRSDPAPDVMIYVCNPFLNLFKMLPQKNYYSNTRHIGGIGGIKLAFDPTKSRHYKVIHAAVIENYDIQIQTYSSETCNWSVYGIRFPSEFFIGFSGGIYWNDAICWLSRWDQVTHLKLNVQHPLVRSIKNPKHRYAHCDEKFPTPTYAHFDDKLLESHGCLLLVRTSYSRSQPLNVYEMRNDYSEWLLKYSVNLDDILVKISTERLLFCVRSIVLGETEDESFLFMEINGMIFKYNIMIKTLSNLFDLGSTRVNFMPWCSSFDGFPFIASFAGV